MPNANYVTKQARPQTVPLLLGAAKTFIVNCDGFDTLVLQCDYTFDSGTGLTFTFADSEGINDPSNPYPKASVNYSTGIIMLNKPFTVATGGASFKADIPFSLTGVGLQGAGNVTVTVTGTATTNSDILLVTPVLLKVS